MNTTNKEMPTVNLGLLRKQLEIYSDDYEVYFGGLEFFRPKEIDQVNKIVQIQFNQTVYQDEQGNAVVQNH